MAPDKAGIKVEIAYARGNEQALVALVVAEGTTIAEVIEHSGIAQRFPGTDLRRCKVGIFSRLVTFDTVLRSGDRVEIYQPLLADPKETRRQRADRRK